MSEQDKQAIDTSNVTHNINMQLATTEQNSKKRPHDSVTPDAENEQNDINESQNNITSSTVDVIMEDVTEPTTDVSKMGNPQNQNEQNQETNAEMNTGENTSKKENNREESPEAGQTDDNTSTKVNDSKI
jgi:hypothetical protein